jgi:tetratricopeptide (TPR) repeat protein
VLALQLYQQAQDLESRESDPNAGDGLLQAVGLLQQALGRDPHFLAAQCLLVRTHLDLYWEDFDHTDARREQARAALAKAVQLQPDAGETRIAQANYDYRAVHDYDRAVSELMLARRSLPNSAEVPQLLGVVYRRQGRWQDALRELLQAVELDPRNFQTLQQTAFTYGSMCRFADATRFLNRAAAIVPGDVFVRESMAAMTYYERGDLQALDALNSSFVGAARPGELTESAYFRLLTALDERNEAAAKAALKDFPARGYQDANNFFLPPEWYAGLVARTFGDTAGAQAAFNAAREKLEETTRTTPDYAEAWSALGLVDAGLGRKAEAIAEARRASELLPISKDAFDGPSLAANLAVVYAWTGEKDLALEQLNIVAHLKGGLNFSGVSYGALQHEVQWDPLRGDPRFEKIVAELAPRT